MKKLVALILCLMMVLSLVGTAFAQEEELRTVTIAAGAAYEPWLTAEYANFESGKLFDEMLAERGLRIEIEGIDDSSFQQVINSRMAAGVDLPDIIGSGWTDFDALSWAQNGMILSLTDLMAQYDEDGSIINYYNEKCPGAVSMTTAPDGHMYWFSYLYNEKYVHPETGEEVLDYGARGNVIRKDWLDKIGVPLKDTYTPDELFDILVAFQENDVNGNGVKDEVVDVSIESFWNGLSKGWNLTHHLLCGWDANDKVFSNFFTEDFKEYITYMQKLYNAGLIDTSVIGTGNLDNAIMTENKASINFGYMSWEGYENNCSDPDALYLPFMLDPDGLENGFNTVVDPFSTTYCKYVVTKDAKDLEAVMDLFDFVYSDEYALVCVYGIENVGYTISENGIVTPAQIPGDADTFDPRYSASWAGLAPAALPNMRVCTLYKEPVPDGLSYKQIPKREFIHRFATEYAQYGWLESAFEDLAIATDEEQEVITDVREQLETYAEELLVDLILGRKSLDDMDKYQKELEQLGLMEYMEVTQARRDRYVDLTK